MYCLRVAMTTLSSIMLISASLTQGVLNQFASAPGAMAYALNWQADYPARSIRAAKLNGQGGTHASSNLSCRKHYLRACWSQREMALSLNGCHGVIDSLNDFHTPNVRVPHKAMATDRSFDVHQILQPLHAIADGLGFLPLRC